MKNLLLLLGFLLLSVYSFSQDVIILNNGKKMEAKVVEVSTTTIKYKRYDQEDGPMRTIEITEVDEIIYNDGTWDKFNRNEAALPEEEETKPVRESKYLKDPIHTHGFALDILIGAAITSEVDYLYDSYTNDYYYSKSPITYYSFGMRISSKWYFGGGEVWRPGLQANWLRFMAHMDPNDFMFSLLVGSKTITPINVGMANVFKFSENMGLEANITGGLNVDFEIDKGQMNEGFAISPEVKFRLKNLAVGLDYMHIQRINTIHTNRNWDIITVSVGVKF